MPKPPPGDGNGDLPPRPRPRPTPRPQPTPPPQPIGPAPAVGRYYITLETMHISKTRSPRHDTVTVMFSAVRRISLSYNRWEISRMATIVSCLSGCLTHV
jgi:hypothetical protein